MALVIQGALLTIYSVVSSASVPVTNAGNQLVGLYRSEDDAGGILIAVRYVLQVNFAIIGALMILTPGIAFTMGIRDFVHGDYLSGTIRMIDALLIAASIAIGTGLVLSLYSLLTGVVVA